MALSTLDKELVYSGLQRAADEGDRDLLNKSFQFFELSPAQQETQIRAEALALSQETQGAIDRLQTELNRLQARLVVLVDRSNGIQ